MISRFIAIACILLVSFMTTGKELTYSDIVLKTYPNNQSISINDIRNNKPIYIKFWATWCKPCMEQMPHFEALQKKYKDKVDIVAVNINMNEVSDEIQYVVSKHGLSMPVWLDNEGELGVALGLVGTPFSVLINRAGDVVYTTHESDSNLDKFIDMLANGQELSPLKTAAPTGIESAKLIKPWLEGEHVLFFTATWCDWYLADSRPDMSKKCIDVQKLLGNLVTNVPNKNWQGFVNHLWTDEKALQDFVKLYELDIDFKIDELGVLFNHFKIRSIPTLLHIKDGKVISRITDFENQVLLLKQLK